MDQTIVPEAREALGYWITQAEQRDPRTVDWVDEVRPLPGVREMIGTAPTGPALPELVQTGAAAQIKLTELVGAMKMAQVQERFAGVARTKMLAEIKESETYKGMLILGSEGIPVECRTWEQFVKALPFGSVETVDEQIRNLNLFGEDFLQRASDMKLGYRDLRRLKKLPEEDRQAVVAEVEANLSDKDAVLALIDGMADKHARENRDSADQIEKLVKALDKKTRHVDAIVKAETETLEAERDALLERTNELETQLGGGDWDKTREAAKQLSDRVANFRKDVISLQRLMPTDKPLPPDLAAEIGAAIFHARELADGVWQAWEDRIHQGAEA